MDLRDLYQEVIVDHNKAPRNFGVVANANRRAEGHNPLCGDKLELTLLLNDEQRIEDIKFQGEGCAISVASASLMTEGLKGKTMDQAEALFRQFHHLVTGQKDLPGFDEVGKLAAFGGVRAYPSRVKCAILCWHTTQAALHGEAIATTETPDTDPAAAQPGVA